LKCNIGQTDRIVRIVAGLVVLAAGWLYGSWWGLVGLIPIGTAVLRFCPAYAPFGISTCGKEKP